MARRRKWLQGVGIAVLGWLLSAAVPTQAGETSAVDPALARVGWMELAIPGKTPTRYARTADGALEARSEASVSILYRMLGADEQDGRIMAWRWRVDRAVPATDPAQAGADDRNRRLVNPHLAPDGLIVLLRPSGTAIGQWFSERIDFAVDYKSAFGTTAPKPMYLAVSADSDDTGARGRARIADIRFLRQ